MNWAYGPPTKRADEPAARKNFKGAQMLQSPEKVATRRRSPGRRCAACVRWHSSLDARRRQLPRLCQTTRSPALGLALFYSRFQLKEESSMVTRGFTGRRVEPDIAARLPPGQHATQDFPVLSSSTTPQIDLGDWRFTLKQGSRPV